MKNKNKILIILAILLVCIIIVIIALLMLRKETLVEEDNPITLVFEDTEIIDNKALFFQIEQNIEKYMKYIAKGDQVAVNSISPSGAIQLKSNNYNTFLADNMYVIDKMDNITVFAHEIARNYKKEDDYYIVVNIDYENNAFEVIPSSKEEYDNAVNNSVQEKYKQDINISSNEYNLLEEESLTDFQILKKYFDDYKFKAINKPQIAFEHIEEEYKSAKFNNDIEQYKTYIQNNVELLQDANIVKHGITKQGEYGNYIFIDNNDSYYKMKETGIYEYTIILDNYTIEFDELKAQYNKLTSAEKAISNMDKVMKLINTKSYNTVYKYFNEEFKNNYFPTIEAFTDYMNKNFFENNIVGNVSIKSEGDIYILSVPYKESLSTVAEEREKVFLMRLKEGTNFELSFEV